MQAQSARIALECHCLGGSGEGVGQLIRGQRAHGGRHPCQRAQAAVAQEAPALLGSDTRVEEVCGWHPPLGRHG